MLSLFLSLLGVSSNYDCRVDIYITDLGAFGSDYG